MSYTTKEIIIIVAYLAKTLGIGIKGSLPWKKKILEDIQHFVKETMGHSVIMGRKTWDSLSPNHKPLSGRQNIVVSKTLQASDLPEGVFLARTLEEALVMATGEKIFIIGGGEIYKEALEQDLANTIIATIVHADFETDTKFPDIPKHWESIHTGKPGIDEKSNLTIQFITLKNNHNPFPLGS